MLHLLASPLSAAFLAFSIAGPPGNEVGLVNASAPVQPAAPLPTFALTALLDKPELRLGETHTVAVQMHGAIADWNPFLTRFHPDDYRCVTAWADEQWLWIKEEFEAPAGQVFVRRGSAADQVLRKTERHDRVALDLVVREMHAGRAWIEVTGARRTEKVIPEGTVLHAINALDMIEREGWALAISELERAMRPNLPGHVRRELATIKATCEEARGTVTDPE